MTEDLAFEALCEVCGIDWQDGITQDQRGRVNAALKELRTIYRDDLTLPAMIRERAAAWAEVYPEIPITPQVITSHWGSILGAAEEKRRREQKRDSANRKSVNTHARRGCPTCGDDHFVSLGPDEKGYELVAPCPDCNVDSDASYWVQGERHQVLSPDEIRRRMVT